MCDYKMRKRRAINHKWIEGRILKRDYEENNAVFTYFCKKLEEGLRIETAIKKTKMRYPNTVITAEAGKMGKENLTIIVVG